MKIGEFAKICHTRISVLRHYDKQNLLKPVSIDSDTGYRYYSKEQITVFFRIASLKQAGFSLSEIREIITRIDNNAEIIALFEKKKAELLAMLQNLESAQNMMLGADIMMNVIFDETKEGILARSGKIEENDFMAACRQIENAIAANNYQRISSYRSYGEPYGNMIEAACDVIKLQDEMAELADDIEMEFVNDEAVIGKWEKVGEYAVKEDFYADRSFRRDNPEQDLPEGMSEWEWFPEYVYFLPDGERYWCYGWTKGKWLLNGGGTSSVNEYELENIDGEQYMFVSLKSYQYRRGGRSVIFVWKQVDHNRYSSEGIARKDNLDLPFEDDRRVIGKWKNFDYLYSKEDFTTEPAVEPPRFFSEIEFMEGGSCTSVYGKEVIAGDDMQVWTKGYVLRKWHKTACAYEIRTVDNRDYLIMEWKSGDYRWGGFDTDYYVFVRA